MARFQVILLNSIAVLVDRQAFRWLRRFVFILLFACSCAPQAAVNRKDGCFRSIPREVVSELRDPNRVLRWASAHRGGGPELGPDNSLKVIQAAARAQLPLLEVDVREVSSGELFLFHDRKLDPRNTSAPAVWYGRRFESLSLREVESLRVAGTQQRPALLKEALQALRGYSSVLELDMKGNWSSIAIKSLDLARTMHMERHLLFRCSSIECLNYIRALSPAAAVLLRVTSPDRALEALSAHPDIVHLDVDDLSKDLVALLRQAGVRVMVKTLESSLDQEWNWNSLFDQGVEIIMTDYPRAIMRRHVCE